MKTHLKKDNGFSLKHAAGILIKYRYLYLMLLPVIIWYLLFSIKPLYWMQIAFKDYNMYKGPQASEWVGLKHFIDFFTGSYFLRTLKNTFLINLYSIIFGFTASIVLALMFNEVKNQAFKKTVQTITYLPHFISVVVVAGIVTTMLSPNSGIINVIIKKLGGESIYFLTKPEWFRTIYTLMNMWCYTGFGTIVYMAAIASIDQQLYEACAIDGGGKFRKLWHVTLPQILPTITIMLVMRMGSILSVGYESIILLYQPVTYETADVISTYVYRTGLESAQYDKAAAVDMVNSIVALIMVAAANKVSNKLTQTGLW